MANDNRGASGPGNIVIKLDFPENKRRNHTTTIKQKPNKDQTLITSRPNVDDKLDLNTNTNRVSQTPPKQTNKTKPNKSTSTSTSTPRPKRNKKRKTTQRLSNQLTKTKTTTEIPRQTKSTKTKQTTRHRQKRDLSEQSLARSTIYIKFDKLTDEKRPIKYSSGLDNRRHTDKDKIIKPEDKQYIIVAPDQNSYDIEIKIRPKPTDNNNNDKITTHTESNAKPYGNEDAFSYYGSSSIQTVTNKRPLFVYDIGGQHPLLDASAHDDQKPFQTASAYVGNRPYHGLEFKRTTTKRYAVYENDDVTVKPYFSTKIPFATHIDQDDDKPFYSFPTIQNTDLSSYYVNGNDEQQHDTEHKPDNDNNEPIESDGSVDTLPIQTNYLQRPSAQRPQHNYRPTKLKPAQNDNKPSLNYGPTYFDDFTTKQPTKLTTTFSIQSNHDEPIHSYLTNDDYTTNRPNGLVTFYTVQTTKKHKRTKPTRPTKPSSYYQQNDDGDDDYADGVEDDDDSDDDTLNASIFNPTHVFSNIVNTFSGYFTRRTTTTTTPTTPTTTRKPYIQHDDFYTYPSIPLNGNSPYSRQNVIDRKHAARKRHIRNVDFDYDQSTYPAALNAYFNDDTMDDTVGLEHKTNTFDQDGYLRPEYMTYFKQNANGEQVTKDAGDGGSQQQQQQQQLQQRRRQQRQRLKQSITMLNSDDRKRPLLRTGIGGANQSVDLIPLNVLTKPER